MSLTSCIRRAGDALDASDREFILTRARALRAEGVAADEAGRRAVDERLAEVQAMVAGEVAGPAKDAPAKLEDVGEKIGGARKDTAVSTGPARKRATDEDRPAWARRFKISQNVTGMDENGDQTGRWVIRDSRSLDWMKQPKQVGRSTFATKEEAEAFLPIAAVGLKHRVVMASTKQGEPDRYEIWRDVTDRKRVKVVEQTFATRDEAMAYMVKNAVAIVETNTTFGEADLPAPPDRERTGPERRTGNVTGEDFKAQFGFRGVEFGNWNNQEERQALMNDAWDGLLDLAEVLGLPPRAIGLNGDLALAFGARGQGLQSARAHYESDRAVINLTKENGAGSLAHEFFHALDHYFGRQDGKTPATWEVQADGTRTLKAKGGDADMASGGFLMNRSGVRPEVRAAYEKLLKTMVKKAEVYVEDAARVDKFTGQAREELARELDMLRKDFSEQKDVRYWKRNNKPASAEVLAEFDTLAKAMLDGDVLALTSDWRIIRGKDDKAKAASRYTNDGLERLGVLYKQVRGRSGFSAEKSGLLDRLRGYMTRYAQRLKMLDDAQSSTEKTRMVPTDFAMNARELDQGRGGDYWTTPHELVARAFQGYVEDKIAERGGTSRFLNYAPENAAIITPWGFKRPYPAGAERKAINAAFDEFLATLQTRTDDDGNVALFSRTGPAFTNDSASPAKLRAAIAKIASTWGTTLATPKVVDTVDDLPPRIRQAVYNVGAENQVRGLAMPNGDVYLVADNIGSVAEAQFVLFHEVYGHVGMRAFLGDSYGTQMRLLRQANPTLAKEADKWFAAYGEAEIQTRVANRKMTPEAAKRVVQDLAIEEALADRAGDAPELKGWQRVMAALQRALRKIGLGSVADMLEGMTEAETLRLLADARATVKGQQQAVGRMEPAMSRAPQTDSKAFRDWFGGSKVVDAEGNPLVVYHGTFDDFSKFSDRKLGANTDDNASSEAYAQTSRVGFWFNTKPMAGNKAGYTVDMPVYLSIQNPKREMSLDWLAQGLESTKGRTYRKRLIEQGYDGIVLTDEEFGGTSYVAFYPEQIKSAIGNNGQFDPANPDIRFSRTPNATPGTGWAMPEGTKFDNFVYKFQDKNIDLKRAVAEITKGRQAIEDRVDAYLQEELFHERAAKRTQDFVKDELGPVMKEMGTRGITMDALDEYLHNRHAEEANKVAAERNLDDQGKSTMPDGGSGIKTADARAYLAKLDPGKRKRLEAVAAKVDAIIARNRQTLVDYGLESQTVVDGWASMFDHYVPLMREDEGNGGGSGTGQGFSIKGKETKSRTGATDRKVVDILANIAMQRERAIVRGEKNRVAVALVGLVDANPAPNFWQADYIPTERVFNDKTGLVEERQIPGFKNRPNVLVAKVMGPNGEVQERAVVFNEDNARAMRMVESLKNLDATQLEGVLGISAKITRYFAAINTQYNPVFGFVNFIRDVQGAVINLTSTPIKGKEKAVLKDVMPALAGVFADARKARQGKAATSQWAGLWEEFQLEGGATGFRDLFRTSADRAKAIEREIDPTAWMNSTLGKVFTVNGILKVPMAQAQKAATWMFGWLSDYNLAMENAVRLSAYKVALDQGMTKQRAASLAKNLTVNFNRKGQAGMQAGALYAFFNASMQGTARMGDVMFEGEGAGMKLSGLGRKILLGGMALGAIQAMMLEAAGFDDDEPPPFVRERSLIIPIGALAGGKEYISIPMPLGWHVIPNLGRMATEFALGGFKEPGKRATDLIALIADAFNPIGNSGLSLQTIAPTALDPLVALSENRDWTGKPIARESFDRTTPGFALAKDTASAPSKWISEAINLMSGGTKYTAGAFSPTPDQIDYLWGQVTGGVGRELSKVEQTATAALTGETLPTYKIPLVGRFVGDAEGPTSQGNRFYENLNQISLHEAQIKGLIKDGFADEAQAYRAENPESTLIGVANMAERQVRKLRSRKRELLANDAPRDSIRQIEEQITRAMTRLNEAVERREMAGA
jgi:molybdopterin converting factor small subunit